MNELLSKKAYIVDFLDEQIQEAIHEFEYVPPIGDRHQVLRVHCLAGHVRTKLSVVLLRRHVARVQQNGQAQRLQGVDVLAPAGVVKVQQEGTRVIVRQVEHLSHRLWGVTSIFKLCNLNIKYGSDIN